MQTAKSRRDPFSERSSEDALPPLAIRMAARSGNGRGRARGTGHGVAGGKLARR